MEPVGTQVTQITKGIQTYLCRKPVKLNYNYKICIKILLHLFLLFTLILCVLHRALHHQLGKKTFTVNIISMVKGTLEFTDEENNGRAQTSIVTPVRCSSAVFYLPLPAPVF